MKTFPKMMICLLGKCSELLVCLVHGQIGQVVGTFCVEANVVKHHPCDNQKKKENKKDKLCGSYRSRKPRGFLLCP